MTTSRKRCTSLAAEEPGEANSATPPLIAKASPLPLNAMPANINLPGPLAPHDERFTRLSMIVIYLNGRGIPSFEIRQLFHAS
jgi:hypothetical protein